MKFSFLCGCATIVLGILSLQEGDYYPTKFIFLYLGIILTSVVVDDMVQVAVDNFKKWVTKHGSVRNRYLHI